MSEAQKVKIGQTNIYKSKLRALKKNWTEIKIVKLKMNFKQYADYMASNKSDHDWHNGDSHKDNRIKLNSYCTTLYT